MRIFIKALILAFFMSTIGVVIAHKAHAADRVCIIASKQEFLDRVGPITKTMRPVPQEMLTHLLHAISSFRVSRGAPPLEADEMLFATLKNGNLAFVMFKDGCVVPGTVIAMSPDAMRAFLAEFSSVNIMSLIGFDA